MIAKTELASGAGLERRVALEAVRELLTSPNSKTVRALRRELDDTRRISITSTELSDLVSEMLGCDPFPERDRFEERALAAMRAQRKRRPETSRSSSLVRGQPMAPSIRCRDRGERGERGAARGERGARAERARPVRGDMRCLPLACRGFPGMPLGGFRTARVEERPDLGPSNMGPGRR